MKSKLMVVWVMCLSLCGAVFAADSATTGNCAEYKFTMGGVDVANGSMISLPTSSSITVSVWTRVTTSASVVKGVKALVAWDRSNAATTPTVPATPLDGKLEGSVFANTNSLLAYQTTNSIVGGTAVAGTTARGYGSYFAGSLTDLATNQAATMVMSEWIKLGDVTLANKALGSKEQYTVSLYNRSGAATGYDSTVTASSGTYSPVVGSEPWFTVVNNVPEPVSVSLLAMGGLALLRRKMA